MPDRAAIVATLDSQRRELEARYRGFGAEVVSLPCTDSEDPGGERWTPKDHLAHLLRVERAFLAMSERTVAGDAAPLGGLITGKSREAILARVHRDNEEHVLDHRDLSVDELLDRLTEARAATLAFIGQLTDEQLALPIPGAPWGDGTIGGVLQANAGHERQHLDWVDAGLAGR
jgi:hypothetical protein